MVTLFVLASAVALYEGRQALHLAQTVRGLTARVDQLQGERDLLFQRLAGLRTGSRPRIPAPALQIGSQGAAASGDSLPFTNLYTRFKENLPKLTGEQAEAYLQAYGTNSFSLLAAYRTSGDTTFLKEAMAKYPLDPKVAFEAVFAKDLSPEQRRQWLDSFEQSAPDNALANYLSAREYLKAGQTDRAVDELIAASGKSQFQDYTLNRRQDDEEAYLAAGYSTAEAKMIASSQVELPQLSELKQLGVQMVDLAKSYRGAGDDASAQALLQMAVNLGQSYSAGDCAISHLVGIAIERIALNAMDPNSPFGGSGSTVQEQLNQLTQQKTELATLFNDNESLFEKMSDQDWINYIDRDKSFGEEAALRWVVSKYGGGKAGN